MAINMLEKYGRNYRAGDIIFSEHEPGNSFYLIHSGKVIITKIVGETEKNLDILGPGDIFGEMAIIEEAPRSASALAETEVKALEFNKENFEILLKSNAAMAIKLLKVFSKRIYDARRKLMILSLLDDEAKVADTLILLAEMKGYNPNEVREFVEPIELEANNQSVSSWCGLKEDITKKILTQFVNQNRILISHNTITIKNINELIRYVSQKRKIPE